MNENKVFDEIKKYIEDKNGFIKHNNMHLLKLEDNYAKMYANVDENSLNPSGIVHGGLIFGLADSVMGMAARTSGRNIVTVNSQVDYLKPGKGKKIIAEAKPIKLGKTLAVFKANIYNDSNELIATSTGTYYYLD